MHTRLLVFCLFVLSALCMGTGNVSAQDNPAQAQPASPGAAQEVEPSADDQAPALVMNPDSSTRIQMTKSTVIQNGCQASSGHAIFRAFPPEEEALPELMRVTAENGGTTTHAIMWEKGVNNSYLWEWDLHEDTLKVEFFAPDAGTVLSYSELWSAVQPNAFQRTSRLKCNIWMAFISSSGLTQ